MVGNCLFPRDLLDGLNAIFDILGMEWTVKSFKRIVRSKTAFKNPERILFRIEGIATTDSTPISVFLTVFENIHSIAVINRFPFR